MRQNIARPVCSLLRDLFPWTAALGHTHLFRLLELGWSRQPILSPVHPKTSSKDLDGYTRAPKIKYSRHYQRETFAKCLHDIHSDRPWCQRLQCHLLLAVDCGILVNNMPCPLKYGILIRNTMHYNVIHAGTAWARKAKVSQRRRVRLVG